LLRLNKETEWGQKGGGQAGGPKKKCRGLKGRSSPKKTGGTRKVKNKGIKKNPGVEKISRWKLGKADGSQRLSYKIGKKRSTWEGRKEEFFLGDQEKGVQRARREQGKSSQTGEVERTRGKKTEGGGKEGPSRKRNPNGHKDGTDLL